MFIKKFKQFIKQKGFDQLYILNKIAYRFDTEVYFENKENIYSLNGACCNTTKRKNGKIVRTKEIFDDKYITFQIYYKKNITCMISIISEENVEEIKSIH